MGLVKTKRPHSSTSTPLRVRSYLPRESIWEKIVVAVGVTWRPEKVIGGL